MQHPAVMGVLQGLRHPGAPPGDRLGIGPPLECKPACRLLDPHALRRLQAVQEIQQVGPGAKGLDLGSVEYLEERDPAEVRHAKQMQAGGRVGPVGIDGNDVGVLQPRQGLRLARAGPRHLEGNGPIGQMLLLGQVNPRECPSSQLLDQAETRDRLAGLGKPGTALASPSRPGRRSPSDQIVNRHDFLKGAGEPGEPDLVFRRLRRLAGFLAEAEFLVEQCHQQLIVELGKTVAVRFDRARLPRSAGEGSGRPAAEQPDQPGAGGDLREDSSSGPAGTPATISSPPGTAPRGPRCSAMRCHPRCRWSGSSSWHQPSIRARFFSSSRTRCTVLSLRPSLPPISLQE